MAPSSSSNPIGAEKGFPIFWYETDQSTAYIDFDHRPFAHFYEGMTGSSFFKDYGFGKGREYVSQRLKDLRIKVEGEPFNETVTVAED